jgi:hypothetical protein
VVVLALAPAAAQAASLQLPSRVEATVEQGGSAQFTIPVSAGGAFTCSTTATVRFDSVYSLSSAGDLTTSDPLGVVFSGADEKGSGNNCEVTWAGAPDPYPVTATVMAASGTPVGDYEGRIAYTVENDPDGGPAGKLSNAGVANVTIHVVPAPAPAPVIIVVPPAQIVLPERITPPHPEFGKSVMLTLLSGKIVYKAKGANQAKELTGSVIVPNGTLVDASDGHVRVTVERDATNTTQDSAEVWGTTFRVSQNNKGITTLKLVGASVSSSRGRTASVTRFAKKKKKKHSLWVNGEGNFQTQGEQASAILRGTYFLTQETDQGTLFVVKRGAVAVRDFNTKRTTVVKQGHSYLARKPVRLLPPRFTG